jgi:3-phenylpropionate/trans-cinnamate dioxygenase ferredoxin reductase subunit
MGHRISQIVIVGAGQAGGRAALALREEGFDGSVLLVGEEDHPPYERPPLSKELLTGERGVGDTYLEPLTRYAELGIKIELSKRAVAIDRTARTVKFQDGNEAPFDRLLLATGSRPRALSIPGASLPGVRMLRDLSDSEELRRRLRPDAHIAIIGAGVIGLEVAASARQLGCSVTVIETTDTPMERLVPRPLGEFFAQTHRAHGVKLITGAAVTRIEAREYGLRLTCSDDATVDADMVLVCIGVVANDDLALAAGLAVEDGILTDADGRTSDPMIFAAGDATHAYNPFALRHIRHESWHNAETQSRAAVRAMLGLPAQAPEVPWFWTFQYDVRFQSAGTATLGEEVVWRGSPGDPSFSALYVVDDVVVGGACVNAVREFNGLKKLIAARRPIARQLLTDTQLALSELAARPAPASALQGSAG